MELDNWNTILNPPTFFSNRSPETSFIVEHSAKVRYSLMLMKNTTTTSRNLCDKENSAKIDDDSQEIDIE